MLYFQNLFATNPPLFYAAVAGVVVILVIFLVVLRRLFFGRRLRVPGASRTRQPRLGIVDAQDLDRERQLVLVRRDNVEHLIMIGGPNDVLIESQIVRIEARASREKDVSGPAPVAAAIPAPSANLAAVRPGLAQPPAGPPMDTVAEADSKPEAAILQPPGQSQPAAAVARQAPPVPVTVVVPPVLRQVPAAPPLPISAIPRAPAPAPPTLAKPPLPVARPPVTAFEPNLDLLEAALTAPLAPAPPPMPAATAVAPPPAVQVTPPPPLAVPAAPPAVLAAPPAVPVPAQGPLRPPAARFPSMNLARPPQRQEILPPAIKIPEAIAPPIPRPSLPAPPVAQTAPPADEIAVAAPSGPSPLDSLEEEMARLLGRPVGAPRP